MGYWVLLVTKEIKMPFSYTYQQNSILGSDTEDKYNAKTTVQHLLYQLEWYQLQDTEILIKMA